MSYNYHEQTRSAYKNIKYGQGTIYSSGCGPASLCNALDALGIASVTVKTMCAYAVSVGARVSGGTDMHKLLQAAAKKYGFTYRTTSKNAELLAHLKAGSAAIVHAGSSYPLFSNGGHFVCAVAASGNDVTVLDSYWYSNKYISTALRRNNVKVIKRGIVRTGITQIGKATADRSPSYYLIAKTGNKQDNKKIQPVKAAEKEKYKVQNLKLMMNGNEQHIDAVNVDGHNYVRLDQLPKLLPVTVGYSGVPIMDTAQINVVVDGSTMQLPGGIIAPGKSLAYVTDLARALGYDTTWDSANKSVVLTKRVDS